MAAIPDSIKIKLEIDTTELDVAIEKLEKFIELQKRSMSLPTVPDGGRADYVAWSVNKKIKGTK